MGIPLFNRLKKRLHRDIAMLQDEVLEAVYSISPKAVLHGGTAIWRCYHGNRFSEDLDFYASPAHAFKQSLTAELKSRNLEMRKFKETKNTVFSKISNGPVEVRLEAALRRPRSFEVRAYERADGTTTDVFTLSPEELITEKINAYKSRRLVRDFYDIYTLSALPLSGTARKSLHAFLSKPAKPVDEKTLRTVVYSGAVPVFEQMIAVLKRRSAA